MQQEIPDTTQIKEGDPMAFQLMVHQTREWGYNVAYRLMGQEEDARDVLQEAYLTCWNKRHQLKNHQQFSPWLYRIIVHKCYDALRSGKRKRKQWEEQEYLQQGETTGDPQNEIESRESMELLHLLVERLSYKQRTVFVLSELEGREQEEVASLLGISRNAVKSNLHHARKTLQELLNYINKTPEYDETVR